MGLTLFGLTGGIASGKSTVSHRWREKGLPVIDADQVAREIVKRDSEGLQSVICEFGHLYLNDDQELDRKKLGALVFSDPNARRTLESILWPYMEEETRRLCYELEKEGHLIACYDSAVIIEQNRSDEFKPLVVVTAPLDIRIARMMKRDGFTEEQAMQRIHAQVTEEQRRSAANYVIESNRPKEETREMADNVLTMVCRDMGVNIRTAA